MENNLISRLKNEHKEILRLINAFKKGKGFMDTEWRDNLFKAKKLFIDHLELEDNILYPSLCKIKSSEGIACRYQEEMQNISEQVLAFIEKYQEDHSGAQFSNDYAALTTALQKRIAAEESELFPLYSE